MKVVLARTWRFPSRALLPVACGLLALSLAGAPAVAQSDPELSKKLDAIAGAAVREKSSVGIVAGVVRGNDTLLLQAYGKADIEADAAMTVDTILALGSTTKQFTAAAILQLCDQGKLGLDDEVTKWLPDFETRGNKVTLRHLLGHTSGVADITAMPELRELRLLRNPDVTRDEVYAIVNKHEFQFPTGTMQCYSNTGYWLLGRVVEKASGTSYEDCVEQKIFAPLGMSRSRYGDNAEKLPRRAAAHGIRTGTPRRLPHIVYTGIFAAGALSSTVEDMVKWMQALHGGKVLSAKSYAEMIAPSRLADGTPTRYGMGLAIAEDRRGLRYIGHSGGGFGFSSEARWHLDAKLAIVVLTNSEPDTITAATEDLAAATLPVPPAAAPFQGDASLLVGKYQGPGRTRGKDLVVEVAKTAEGIAFSIDGAGAVPLLWVENSTFRRDEAQLTFRGSASRGPATELRLDTVGDHFVLKRQ